MQEKVHIPENRRITFFEAEIKKKDPSYFNSSHIKTTKTVVENGKF